MKTILTCALLLFSLVTIKANYLQSDSSKVEKWLGEFEGTLYMYSSTKEVSSIPMKIRNFQTDTAGTYGWYLIYGEDEASGTRPYYLKTIDPSIGHYVVDEKNSIVLDTYMIGDKLISDFQVEGSTITSIYSWKDKDTLTFEIIAGKSDRPSSSGNINDIPLVVNYQVAGYHFAELHRIIPEDK